MTGSYILYYWRELLLEGEIDFYAGSNSMQLAGDETVVTTCEFMPYNSVIVSKNDCDHIFALVQIVQYIITFIGDIHILVDNILLLIQGHHTKSLL